MRILSLILSYELGLNDHALGRHIQMPIVIKKYFSNQVLYLVPRQRRRWLHCTHNVIIVCTSDSFYQLSLESFLYCQVRDDLSRRVDFNHFFLLLQFQN